MRVPALLTTTSPHADWMRTRVECDVSVSLSLAIEFRGQDVDRLNRRRLGQQFRRLGHQRSRNLTRQVSLPTGIVRKRVEDPERRRSELEREPDRGGRFRLSEWQRAL